MEKKIKKYNTAIFDLDGTLLNTIVDIASSVNFALEKNGFATHDINVIKTFVGNGANMLIKRAIAQECDESVFNKVFADYMEHYSIHKNDNTKPYEGIMQTLAELKQKGIKIAILSNKPDVQTKPLAKEIFPNLIDYAKGQSDDMPSKPYPDGVFHILKQLDSKIEETIFIGDSDVDILTGKNAKLYTIGVSWGFRSVEELIHVGADKIINKAEDLIDII